MLYEQMVHKKEEEMAFGAFSVSLTIFFNPPM
jgi:hypothetical protein